MNEILSLISFFGGLSLLAFGGGAATLPAIQNHAVGAGWVTNQQFLHVYALGQLAPGPSTMYIAGIGFVAAGWAGAAAAGLAFVIPSATLVVIAGTAWARWPDSHLKMAVRTGLTPVTVALLIAAAWHLTFTLPTLAETTGHGETFGIIVMLTLAVAVAVMAQVTRLSPVWLVLGSGLVGLVLLR